MGLASKREIIGCDQLFTKIRLDPNKAQILKDRIGNRPSPILHLGKVRRGHPQRLGSFFVGPKFRNDIEVKRGQYFFLTLKITKINLFPCHDYHLFIIAIFNIQINKFIKSSVLFLSSFFADLIIVQETTAKGKPAMTRKITKEEFKRITRHHWELCKPEMFEYIVVIVGAIAAFGMASFALTVSLFKLLLAIPVFFYSVLYDVYQHMKD